MKIENKIHESADVQSADIGHGTTIWQFVVILPEAKIGRDCNICAQVLIENDVQVGDRVTVKSGVQLWDGVRLEDDVFIGPNVTFTNDKFPRSKQHQEKHPITLVRSGASIGANATVLPGITIGAGAMVGAGAVVTSNVPPKATVIGNPARIVGYVDTEEKQMRMKGAVGRLERSSIKGVGLHRVQHVKDLRGDLIAIELEKQLPFSPKRTFFVHNVPNNRVRGEHAHKVCHQFLLCVHGSVAVIVDDGEKREEYILDEPHIGIHIPPRVWGIQYKYSQNAVLFVLASHEYDATDYLRDYEQYLDFLKL